MTRHFAAGGSGRPPLALLLALLACVDPPPGDSGADADDRDTGTDTRDTTDIGDTGDTGGTGETGDTGDAEVVTQPTASVGSTAYFHSVGDVDGDGGDDFTYCYLDYDQYTDDWYWFVGGQETTTLPCVPPPEWDTPDVDYSPYCQPHPGAAVGDLTGDGRPELVQVASYAPYRPPGAPWGALDVWDHSERGTQLARIMTLPEPDGITVLHLLGDHDEDGSADLLVGSSLINTSTLLDPDLDLSAPERTVLPDFGDSQFRLNFGLDEVDFDGDGLDELFTGRWFYWGTDLALAGTYTEVDALAPSTLSADLAGCTSGPAGDVTGDGREDLWFSCGDLDGSYVGEDDVGRHVVLAELRFDGSLGLEPFADVHGTSERVVGAWAGSVGDADGDGLGDVGVGRACEYWAPYGCDVRVFPGADLSGTVLLTEPASILYGDWMTDLILVDYDGDGLQDVMVGRGGGGGVFPYADILP